MSPSSDRDQQLARLESELSKAPDLAPVERSLRAVVDAVPDIIYRVDAQGDIVFISEAIRQYGHDPAALVGTCLFDLIHAGDRERARHRVNERRTGDRSTRSLELRFLTADAGSVPMEVHESDTKGPTLLVDAQGIYAADEARSENFLYTQGVARDVSGRRRVERSLEVARDELTQRMGEHARQIRTAYHELERQTRARERLEAETDAVQRIRDEIWRMDDPDHVGRVLRAISDGLHDLGVDFQGISINEVLRGNDGLAVRYYTFSDVADAGTWRRSEDRTMNQRIEALMLAGEPTYRRDLQADDPLGERQRLEAGWGPGVRAVVDVPFESGTLAINSSRPDAFSDDDLAVLAKMATVLHEGFHRVRDLEALQARTREAEELAARHEAALQRELVLGRLRAHIQSMRSLGDAPDEGFWKDGLRALGVPADGVSLQFPAVTPEHYVTFLFYERSYSEEVSLDRHPWIRQAWESGKPVVVPAGQVNDVDFQNWSSWCIVEVPLPGGGSLGVNRQDGESFDADMVASMVAFADVVAEGVQRLRDFERLKESEERYRHLVEHLPIGVTHSSLEGRILYHNACAREIFDHDPDSQTPLSWSQLLGAEDRESLAAVLEGDSTHVFEQRIRIHSGRRLWVRGMSQQVRNPVTGRVEVHGFFEDVTAQKAHESELAQLEEQLRQSQKMEAVGQLTAGIAHNFNNMLQAISGNLQLALVDADGDLGKLLGDADRVTHRAAEMIRQLMVFARQGIQTKRQDLDLRPLVTNTIEICRRTFDRRIEIDADLAVTATVTGDAGLLQQVFLNLLINARDALQEADGPAPRIRVSIGPPVEAEGLDEAIEIVVTDNGVGMDEATRRRIYDPFFTTKPVDRGTGLGLAMVYGIVTQHDGRVDCDSEPGEGTTFRVLLPVTGAVRPAPELTAAPTPECIRPSLLIIDDEELVRETTGRLLERKGYRVLLEDSGPAGLARLADETPDLVLLDLNMPGMSGAEVLAEIRRLHPGLRVVIFTGYAGGEAEVEGADGIVRKPFIVSELIARIERLLAD